MIRFKATDDQLYLICCLAVDASRPVGLGHLHHNSARKFTREDMALAVARSGSGYVGSINIDYYWGRMVKLFIKRENDYWLLGQPGFKDAEKPHPEYQSFCRTYPTWQSLLEEAGVMDYEFFEGSL